MEEAVAAFLHYLDREKNASPHTVRAYGDDLAQFRRHLRDELGREPGPKDVDHLVIRSFLARLHTNGVKKVSASRKLASLRAFFRFLCREGVLDKNPARLLRSPRLERRIPGRLEETEVASLLEVPGDGDAPLRARALFELLYATGIRCSELVGLDLSEVDFEARTVLVLGKGSKERLVPFGQRAAEAIRSYLPARLRAKPQGGAL